jgi:hypothetical protein
VCVHKAVAEISLSIEHRALRRGAEQQWRKKIAFDSASWIFSPVKDLRAALWLLTIL